MVINHFTLFNLKALIFKIIYKKDTNKNGRLDGHEVERIIKGLQSINGDCEDIMKWDTDNTGSLSEEEFINFVLENPVLKKYFINLIKIHD